MKKFRCLAIASPSFAKNKTLVDEATILADRLVINDAAIKWTETELISWLNDSSADAAIIGTEPLTQTGIQQLTHLKAIGKYGVGCDNIDVEALALKNIHFFSEGGINRRCVSELVLSFMLAHCRNVFSSVDRMQRGIWNKDGGVQLSNRTIGIVGLGFIGTDVARLLQPFGSTLLGHDILDKRFQMREFGVECTSYDDLLARSDIVTFHVPGDSKTKNLFSASQISQLKKPLFVVNTSRGSVVDFSAVTTGVREGKLSGFACDVFDNEPFLTTNYTIDDGFYFTPHIGGNAKEAVLAMGRSAILGLRQHLLSN